MKRSIAFFLLAGSVTAVAFLVWANPGGEWRVCVRYNCASPDPTPASGWTPKCKKINHPGSGCTATCPDTTTTADGCVDWTVGLEYPCDDDSYMVWAVKGAASTDTDRIHWDDPGAILCAPGGP